MRGLEFIFLTAAAFEVGQAEIFFSIRGAVPGRFLVPLERRREVGIHTIAIPIAIAQKVLRFRNANVGNTLRADPPKGLLACRDGYLR